MLPAKQVTMLGKSISTPSIVVQVTNALYFGGYLMVVCSSPKLYNLLFPDEKPAVINPTFIDASILFTNY